jgi:hypothetical protein
MLTGSSTSPVTGNTADAPGRPRGTKRPSHAAVIRPKNREGVGNAGCSLHPQSHVQNKKAHEVVTTGSPEQSGIPAHNGFNGFLRALLGDRLSCHRHLADCQRVRARLGRHASTRFDAGIEASGPHDFAVRSSISRQRAIDGSRETRPAISSRAQCCRVHRIPSRVRDDRDRPSLERDGAGYESDLGEARRNIFLQMGLDRKLSDLLVGQSVPSFPSPLWGGWHVVSKANNMSGGGNPVRILTIAPPRRYAPTPERASLVSTPQRRRDKKESGSIISASPVEACHRAHIRATCFGGR